MHVEGFGGGAFSIFLFTYFALGDCGKKILVLRREASLQAEGGRRERWGWGGKERKEGKRNEMGYGMVENGMVERGGG